MTRLKKRITTMGMAVVMATSMMSLSANAFTATSYKRTTGGAVGSAYVSCFVTGTRTNKTVSGVAWTKTSSNNTNVYNPNVAYEGYTYASASVGGVGCGAATSYEGTVTKNFSLAGCTTAKTVKTTHIFDDDDYGSCSTTLSVSSDS